MKRRIWTKKEIRLLKREYPDTPTAKIAAVLRVPVDRVYSKAAKMGLKKSEQYMASPDACRLRRGDNVGAAYRFKPGHVPANKGKKGISYPGMRATQFKPGQNPRNWKPIGSERLCDGYLQRKMTDTGYPPHDWKPVHVLLWVEHYGPVPSGYAVAFIDGDKKRVVIENLVLLSRADLMRRNTYHNNYPKEICELIQLRGQIVRQINKRTRNEKQN